MIEFAVAGVWMAIFAVCIVHTHSARVRRQQRRDAEASPPVMKSQPEPEPVPEQNASHRAAPEYNAAHPSSSSSSSPRDTG